MSDSSFLAGPELFAVDLEHCLGVKTVKYKQIELN